MCILERCRIIYSVRELKLQNPRSIIETNHYVGIKYFKSETSIFGWIKPVSTNKFMETSQKNVPTSRYKTTNHKKTLEFSIASKLLDPNKYSNSSKNPNYNTVRTRQPWRNITTRNISSEIIFLSPHPRKYSPSHRVALLGGLSE